MSIKIVGDKERFAIQWDASVLEGDDPNRKWYPAELCFWIGGQKVGDYEDTMQINFVVVSLENFLFYESIRHHPFLYGKSQEDIFNHVYQRARWFVTDYEKNEIEIFDFEPFKNYFLKKNIKNGYTRFFLFPTSLFHQWMIIRLFFLMNLPTAYNE